MEITGNNRLVTSCLLILTGIAVTAGLIYTKPILVPFVISLFIYLALVPPLSFLQSRLKVSHNIAVIMIAAIYLLISALLIVVFIQSFESIISGAGMYRARIIELISMTNDSLPTWAGTLDMATLKDQVAQIPVLKLLRGLTGDIFSLMANSALVVIFTLFLLVGDPAKIENDFFREFQKKVSQYVVAKFFVSALTAIITVIALLAVGADLAMLFALLTFLFNFIPNIGSLIALALPLPVIFLQFGFGAPFWVVLGVCGVTQFFVGNIIEPKMLGDSLDLHPITVLLFLMFWGLVWGLPGMFLAVPITSLLKILLSRIEVAKPLAELLAGRI